MSSRRSYLSDGISCWSVAAARLRLGDLHAALGHGTLQAPPPGFGSGLAAAVSVVIG